MEPNSNLYERYSRQILLKEFGEAGQQRLMTAKVLVAGAGGLGCPALQYLTAAGVGTIGIIDDDIVALHNLHRQVLYSVNDIGQSKAETAAKVLGQLNPEIDFVIYNEKLTTQNALAILGQFDIIIDGTDNFPTRYMINDACVLLRKPLVFGAVSAFEGQVSIFNCFRDGERSANYRDLFPQPPKDGEVRSCAEAGVLGVVPGIIGAMQANEAIKLITGIGEPLINRLFTYNALNNQTYELVLSTRKETNSLIPGDAASFKGTEYGPECSLPSVNLEITTDELDRLIAEEDITVIDVREWGEEPDLDWISHKRVPMSAFNGSIPAFEGDVWVFVCQTGKRSLQVAQRMMDQPGIDKKIYSLKGGVLQWKHLQ
jgi:adenylyltransferase/sulfurtransferase